ncbi:MAG: glucose-1-phosphate adenylyltransferase [Actinomycetota bacterium]|jgi:glucose-1-phosphate adenylyltransferase|nr:glucose-1-phosphate adenylyltransferase [Actinomycetota bacterium]MDA3006589.1 glucose-1-phosphate adenylyltransferase [Actinomycetota bacterium]MDA3033977.1 glucose-1-phosphate adenylyltransferase [Actinomycetota bacterium]
MASDPTVLVMVLAGGEGKRLLPLTNDRAKPAVPFGGAYRIIDFAVSNFANAGYLKVVVLTQYKSHSLDRHISQTWRFSTMLDDYVTTVPAQMRRGPQWFQGSADAIYQNLNLIYDERPDVVCVFGADHIYRMDPRQMVDEHRGSGAGVTVAAIPVPRADAHQFGIIEAADDGRILAFHEKPSDPPAMPGNPDQCLASMGNYVFDTQTLIDVVTPNSENPLVDMGGDVIPELTRQGVARVYDFSTNRVPGQDSRERGYWRDVGTIDAYYDANMDLIDPVPVFNLYNQRWPVYTHRKALPPAKVSRGIEGEPAVVDGTLLCQGSVVSGAHVERSIISPAVFIDHDAHVTESIVMEGVHVGAGARLHRCIIDKNVVIPPGERIGFDRDLDRQRYTVSDSGIVVVEKERAFG